ncbi:MAG: hypothetical protein QGD88_02375 [Anaerolineae bacterium]|nr:hypothetical protein [Anaerolineae bacterium]
MPKWILATPALLLGMLACSLSDFAPLPPPEIEPSALPTFGIPSELSAPTETPLPGATSTPDVPVAWPKELGVHCRYGPGVKWEAISSLPAETEAEIFGRSVNTRWWYIVDPQIFDSFCWVAFDVVNTAGNMNSILIVEPPTATVTKITVDVLVSFLACGSSNQVTFSGSIKTNGKATVTYYWEVAGDAQSKTPEETIQFSESVTQEVKTEFFSADCGDYSVSLMVTSPNGISTIKAFSIQAP